MLAQDSEVTEKPIPGSEAAISAGCCCPVMDNAYGRGYSVDGDGRAIFVCNEHCQIHGGVTWKGAGE